MSVWLGTSFDKVWLKLLPKRILSRGSFHNWLVLLMLAASITGKNIQINFVDVHIKQWTIDPGRLLRI